MTDNIKLTPDMIDVIENLLDEGTNVEIHRENDKVVIVKVQTKRKVVSKISIK